MRSSVTCSDSRRLTLVRDGSSSPYLLPNWPPTQPIDAHHEIYLMCDDIHATVNELKEKGAKFTRPITDTDWGRVTALQLPGGDELAIYEPRHNRPLSTSH